MVATTCRSNTPFPMLLDGLGFAPGGVSQKLSGKWGPGAEKLQQVAKNGAEGCGVP